MVCSSCGDFDAEMMERSILSILREKWTEGRWTHSLGVKLAGVDIVVQFKGSLGLDASYTHVGWVPHSCSYSQLLVSFLSTSDWTVTKKKYHFLRGLKYIAKNLTERIESITQKLANSDYDIIALQEIWVFTHYEHVRQSIFKRLPYSKFFYRFVFLISKVCLWESN